MSKYKIVSLVLVTALLVSAVGIAKAADIDPNSVWTGPAGDPPTKNVYTPLNVGSSNQTKAGGVSINGILIGMPPLPDFLVVQKVLTTVKGYFPKGIEFGYMTLGRADKAGDVEYINTGDHSLDIYGGGKSIGTRLVNIFDNLFVHGTINAREYNICTADGSCTTFTTNSKEKYHTADTNKNWAIDGNEMSQFSTLANSSTGYHCASATTYAPGPGDRTSCPPHSADYSPQDWNLSVSEIGRFSQYRTYQYRPCEGGEDGFCLITAPSPTSNVSSGTSIGQTLSWVGSKWEPNSILSIVSGGAAVAGRLGIVGSGSALLSAVTSPITEQPGTLQLEGTNAYGEVYIPGLLTLGNASSPTGSAKFIYRNGNQGAGKVLVSNGVGVADWMATSTLGISGGDTNWTKTGDAIANSNAGNVGIGTGTNAPVAKLDITTTGDGASVLRLGIERAWSFMQEKAGSVAELTLKASTPDKSFNIKASDGGTIATFRGNVPSTANGNLQPQVSLVPGGGKVGIGTTNPAQEVELVNNQSNETGLQVTNTSSAAGPATAQVGASNDGSNGGSLRLITTGPRFVPAPGQGDPAFAPDTAILRSGGGLTGGLVISSANGCGDGVASICGTRAGSIRFDTRDDEGQVRYSLFDNNGSLGIKMAANQLPQTALDVNGYATIRQGLTVQGLLGANSLLLPAGAGAGKVLVSDENGLASWAMPTSVGNTYVAAPGSGIEGYVLDDQNHFRLANGGVTTIRLADGAVTGAKIAARVVDNSKLADGAVTSRTIANGQVTAGKIADGAVTGNTIADNAITATKIAPNSVGAQRLMDNSVIASKIVDGVVSLAKLAANSVDSSKIVNGAITSTKIADKAVTAAKLDQMGAANGQVLQWNGTAWAPTTAASGLPTATTGNLNQLLRFNGTSWVTGGAGILTDGTRVAIGGTSVPATGFKLKVTGGITTDNLQITNEAGSGKVLTSDSSGIASWRDAGVQSIFCQKTNAQMNQGDVWTGACADVSSAKGTDDVYTMTCSAAYPKVVSGGAVCAGEGRLKESRPANDLLDNWTGVRRQGWKVRCRGDGTAIETMSIVCSK